MAGHSPTQRLPGKVVVDPSGGTKVYYPDARDTTPQTGSASLHSLLQGTGAQGVDPIQQMLDLELQAIDAQYGSGGGGGGPTYSAGPAVANLNQFGDLGDTKLAELYAGLNDYISKGGEATKQSYADTTNKVSGYYDQGSKDIQAAAQSAQQQIADKAALSPAGKGAAGDSQAAANASIQRQAAIEATNKSNQLATLGSLGTGHEAIVREILAGTEKEGAAQRSRLKNQIAAQIAQVNQQVAAANAKSAASGASNEGKKEAAKLRATKDAIGAGMKQSGVRPKGIQGVIQRAQELGHPELASKFMSMLSASKVKAAGKNQESMLNPLGGHKVTDPDTEFQAMLSALSSPDINDEHSLMNLIQSTPELKGLNKYIKMNPVADTINKLPDWAKKQMTDKLNASGRVTYLDTIAPQDKQILDRYIQQVNNQQDILSQLYEIYGGHY